MSGIVQVGGVALASHDGGTNKVSLDSGIVFPALHGIVGTSGCNVYPAEATPCAASAETKILFKTEREDIADEFDSEEDEPKFTVTVAGMYYIMVQVTLQDFEDGKAMQAIIKKSNATIALHRVNNGRVDHASSSVSTIVTLAVDDYIEGYVWHNNSSSRNTTATSRSCLLRNQ